MVRFIHRKAMAITTGVGFTLAFMAVAPLSSHDWVLGQTVAPTPSVAPAPTADPAPSSAPSPVPSVETTSSEEMIFKPVGRVNPDQPVRVVLMNQTTLKLEYGLTTSRVRRIDAGAEIVHDRVLLPASGVFYPVLNISDPDLQPAFKVDVSVSKNVVTIKVQQIENGADGDSAVQIRRNGSIFVF